MTNRQRIWIYLYFKCKLLNKFEKILVYALFLKFMGTIINIWCLASQFFFQVIKYRNCVQKLYNNTMKSEDIDQSNIIQTYRDLHQIPEIGLKQYKTTAFIKQFLSSIQGLIILQPTQQITGLICKLQPLQTNAQAYYLFRCDIDALPFKQDTNLSYSSTNGMHHACGHDAHTTMMLYAVRSIALRRKQLKRGIIFCFQPGEEGHGGAAKLIKAYPNLFQKVQFCFAIHNGGHKLKGCLAICPQYATSNSSRFQITIKGKSNHIMNQHLAVDANRIGSQIVNYIYSIKSTLDPRQLAIIAVTKIQGGENLSSISDKMSITGSVRSLNIKLHQMILGKIKQYSLLLCKSQQAEVEFNFPKVGYRAIKNDKKAIQIVEKVAKPLFNQIQWIETSMAGEDFCQFSQRVPSCYMVLGAQVPESLDPQTNQTVFPIHTNKYRLNQEALKLGTQLWIELAFS